MSLNPTTMRYEGAQGRAYHETKRVIPDRALPWVARLRKEKLAPFVRQDDVVLEFGVGLGWNLAELRCRRRIGLDVADFLEPVVRSLGIEYVRDAASVPAASVDVVVCHHALEHVLEPAQVLEQMRTFLRPGGSLLLFVPYEKEGRYRTYRPAEPNHHLYSWNVQTLANLVSDCGFKIERAGLGTFGYDRFAAVWAVRLGVGEGGFRLLRRVLHLLRPLSEVRVGAAKPAGQGAETRP